MIKIEKQFFKCEYCGKEYSTEEECESHESKCLNKKLSSINFRISQCCANCAHSIAAFNSNIRTCRKYGMDVGLCAVCDSYTCIKKDEWAIKILHSDGSKETLCIYTDYDNTVKRMQLEKEMDKRLGRGTQKYLIEKEE